MNARDKIVNYAETHEDELMYVIKLLVDRVDTYGANEVADILVDPDEEHLYEYVGNDTTVFDETGECTEMELPFTNITVLASLLDTTETLPVEQFKTLVNNDINIAHIVVSELYKFENVLIAYDRKAKIHYFFV
jgi:hypothetical protein